MLQFLAHYPFKTYLRHLLPGSPQGPVLSWYFSPQKTMLLTKDRKTERFTFHPDLRRYIGAPTLSAVVHHTQNPFNTHIPSNYRREIVEPHALERHNDAFCVIDIESLWFGMHTLEHTENIPTVRDLKILLFEDPSEVISVWTNARGDYFWEILDPSLKTLSDNDPTPPKVICAGLPLEEITNICLWSEALSHCLISLLPAPVLLAKSTAAHMFVQGNDTFFLIHRGETGSLILFLNKGKTSVLSYQHDRELVTSEILEILHDIQKEEDICPDNPVHIWGFPPEDYLFQALKDSGWTRVTANSVETLATDEPLPCSTSSALCPEAWMLKRAIEL